MSTHAENTWHARVGRMNCPAHLWSISTRLTCSPTAPTGLAMFRDDFRTFRTLAEHARKNLIHWSEYDQGGHYASHQVPDLLVSDVQKFFRSLGQ